MSAVWKPRAGAWRIDERIVHLADPLPETRTLVGLVLSDYSFRLLVGTMRDTADIGWLLPAILSEEITARMVDEIADALAENLFGHPRWVVQRLWTQALGLWREIDAELGQRGVDVLALPADRATNVIYGALHRRHSGKEDQLRRWISELEDKPARVLATDTGMEAAAAEWFAAAGMLPGGLPPMPRPPAGVDSELTFT